MDEYEVSSRLEKQPQNSHVVMALPEGIILIFAQTGRPGFFIALTISAEVFDQP